MTVLRRGAAVSIALLMLACGSKDSPTSPSTQTSTPGTYASDPASAELAVADVSNFWNAYDAYVKGDKSAFQAKYLSLASPGLIDFIRVRSLTEASVAQMVDLYPRYFAALKPVLSGLTSGAMSTQVRANYATMQALYPATVFPTVTFLVGRFSTGGTISNNRILVGSEFYGGDASVPKDELGTFQKTNVHTLNELTLIVAHEHVHILQSRAGGIFGKKTLLEQALSEGSADFVAELVTGGNINAWMQNYGMTHEHDLWVEFKSQMSGTDISNWLYNQGTSTSRPGDLGYFIGYRMAQAYYAKAVDKKAAVKDIIEVKDAAGFLATSGYNP